MKKILLVAFVLFSGAVQANEIRLLNCVATNGVKISFSGIQSAWVRPINVPKATLLGIPKFFVLGPVQLYADKNIATIQLIERDQPHDDNYIIALDGKVKLNKKDVLEGVIYPAEDMPAKHRAVPIRCEYFLEV